LAKYTIISDIGRGIISLLRAKLVPEPIDKPEKIGICEPKERGEYIVGVHPYDIKEDTSGQNRDPVSLPDGTVQDPPAMIELYYMISVSSKAQIDTRSAEESRIIGRVIQVFKDNPVIPQVYMPRGVNIESIPISLLPIEMEEKVKIWTMFGESYKLSVFYVVGPVAIDSEVIRKPQKRVETVFLGSTQYKHRKIIQFETRIKDEEIEDEYTESKNEEGEEEDEDIGDVGDEGEDSEGEEDTEEGEDSEEGEEDTEENEDSEEGEENTEESEDSEGKESKDEEENDGESDKSGGEASDLKKGGEDIGEVDDESE
jgi:hypothetical protein